MADPLFIDVEPLCCAATDEALEFMYKSIHDHDDGIWLPHESVLVRNLIELFTQRGLDRLDAVHQQILKWESGVNHKPVMHSIAPPKMMSRWNEHELSLVKIYLESLPPGSWTLDDHMMAVEYLVQRYLPIDELTSEADWLSAKSSMMGKVQASMDEKEINAANADKILAALPSTTSSAVAVFGLPKAQKAVMDFSRARTAENVQAISESVRHKVKHVILQHLEEKDTLPAGVPSQSLESKLFDQFAGLNRDWRRIAVTEAGNAQLEGLVASLEPGSKVKRSEYYKNACAFCKKIHGVVVTVVEANHPDKNPETMIWPGKNNIGRSASPRKRVGDKLIFRDPDEMWQIPAGLVHPHCRGQWLPLPDDNPDIDPEFKAWLKNTLA